MRLEGSTVGTEGQQGAVSSGLRGIGTMRGGYGMQMDRERPLSIMCHGICGGGCFQKNYSSNSWQKITRSSWEASIHQVSATEARPVTHALSLGAQQPLRSLSCPLVPCRLRAWGWLLAAVSQPSACWPHPWPRSTPRGSPAGFLLCSNRCEHPCSILMVMYDTAHNELLSSAKAKFSLQL